MKIFNGRQEADKLEKIIRDNMSLYDDYSELAIILVGDDPSSLKYVNLKKSLCSSLGIRSRVYHISESITDYEILEQSKSIIRKKEVGGLIVQLPLPRKTLYDILNQIPPEKDLDLLNSENVDNKYPENEPFIPPVVRAVDHFVRLGEIEYKKINAILLGEGRLIGQPIKRFLENAGTKVTTVQNYKTGSKIECDLLILGTGIPVLVRGDDINPGCNVIDFGSSVVNGKTVGDLDLSSEINHLGIVAKSPGGVGPLVVRYLIMNFLGI